MINTSHSLILIAVMAGVTAMLRFLPFIIFSSGNIPKSLRYLGDVLPGAIIGMLVVYCFKSTVVLSYPFALPEIIAAAVIVALYLWKRNVLVSVGLGTVLYMVLVQVVFV